MRARTLESMDRTAEGAQAPVGWRRLLAGWMAITVRFGSTQTLVILALFYALILGPVALAFGLTGRDLLERRRLRASGSAWRDADSAVPDLERAKLTS